MKFVDTDKEQIETPSISLYFSDVSNLINHYQTFSNTLQANSATGIVKQLPTESSEAKDTKVEAAPVPSKGMEQEPIPAKITLHELPHASNNIPPGLFAVILAHNKELTIGSLVHLCKVYVDQVIVVDEGSDDRTAEIAAYAGAHLAWIGEDTGKSQAMFTGFQAALERGCSAVVMYDSEGMFRAREIPTLVADVMNGTADLVIGSRLLGGRKGIPSYRPWVDNASSTVGGKLVAPTITDPESTFFAISRTALLHLDFDSESNHPGERMISRLAKKGLVIREIPVIPRHEIPKIGDDGLPLYRGHKIAVVVPAYNEELLIGETLAGIPDYVCRIYVVNDGSKDKTQEVIDYYVLHDRSIIPIVHEINKGAGAAISTGYRIAFNDEIDIVATMDGDNQMDPTFLPQLLDPVIDVKCDFTMGNRLINREFRKGMSKLRFFGNSVLTLLTKIASGYWSMVDPQNGFTAISRRALERIDTNSLYPRYGYLNDRLVRLNIYGFRVINVPHPARYGKETSGIKYPTYVPRLSWLLLKSFLKRLEMKYIVFSFHPLVFFYASGVLFTVLAFILGIYSLFYKFVEDKPIFVPAILTLILLSLGLQGIFFGMFFDMQQEKSNNGWYD